MMPPKQPRGSDQEPPPQQPFRIPGWVIPVLLILGFAWFVLVVRPSVWPSADGRPIDVPYSFFREQVSVGNVASVLIKGSAVEGEFKTIMSWPPPNSAEAERQKPSSSRLFTTALPPITDNDLSTLLAQNKVIVRASEPSPSLLFILFNLAPLIVIAGLIIWMITRSRQQQGNIFGFGQTRARRYNTQEAPLVTFDDVAGEVAAKQELSEMVDFLRDPDKYLRLGARIPRGVLLVGPPGTGKTLLAKAVAGEAKVPFFSLSASEFVEMFVGVGASRVRDLFTRAKAAAPCIIFIDELDAVGRRRGTGLGGGNDEREQTLNQLLVEMDGFDQRETIIVMAATNRPDVLDPALLRPGRFDRQVTVDLPDRSGREQILKIHTRSIPLSQDVELAKLAGGTIGFSGADLENLANEAALTAARTHKEKVTMRDFEIALDRLMLGSERPPLINELERKTTAYHEAGHAVAGMLTPHADPVFKVTIVPRGRALGVTQSMPEDDRRNYSREYLDARLIVLMAGRAAEEVALGTITSGAENDLRVATHLARTMVAQLGMNETVGPVNYGDMDQQPFLGYSLAQQRQYSEHTASIIDREVKHIVETAHQKAKELLQEHRAKLDRLVEALLTEEIIDQKRLLDVLEIEPKEPKPELHAATT